MFNLKIDVDFIDSRLCEAVLSVYSLKAKNFHRIVYCLGMFISEIVSFVQRDYLNESWLKKFFIPANFHAPHFLSWVSGCPVNSLCYKLK